MTHQRPILTVTINPALDVSSAVDRVLPEHKLRCGPSRFDPGGGGVNVSRAIRNLGGDSLAVFAVGGPTGQAYRGFVDEAGIVARVVTIAGTTRESFTVDESSTRNQFRFVLQGPTMARAEWMACLSVIEEHLPRGGFLVLSGSLPPGVPDDLYARAAALAVDADVNVVVDAAGPPLRAALDAGVYLITPSRSELSGLVDATRELDESALAESARALVDAGGARIVALTLGADGALLASREGVLRLRTPEVPVLSAVGAGDAFLAGLVLRLAQGHDLQAAFRTAVAAGSATAMRPATELCSAEDVARLEIALAEDAPGQSVVAL